MSDQQHSKPNKAIQKILVFQQSGSAEQKIAGIRAHGKGLFDLQIVSIDDPLPDIIDDSTAYLPAEIEADLVLDFLRHPDLSYDLSRLCEQRQIPLVASGKKSRPAGTYTPPT